MGMAGKQKPEVKKKGHIKRGLGPGANSLNSLFGRSILRYKPRELLPGLARMPFHGKVRPSIFPGEGHTHTHCWL
jgi:hypothetical protein